MAGPLAKGKVPVTPRLSCASAMSWVSVTLTETIDWGVAPVAAVVSSGLPLGPPMPAGVSLTRQGDAAQGAASLGAIGIGGAHANGRSARVRDRDYFRARARWRPGARGRAGRRGSDRRCAGNRADRWSDTEPGRNSPRRKPAFRLPAETTFGRSRSAAGAPAGVCAWSAARRAECRARPPWPGLAG